jgi:hypothetical protein
VFARLAGSAGSANHAVCRMGIIPIILCSPRLCRGNNIFVGIVTRTCVYDNGSRAT